MPSVAACWQRWQGLLALQSKPGPHRRTVVVLKSRIDSWNGLSVLQVAFPDRLHGISHVRI